MVVTHRFITHAQNGELSAEAKEAKVAYVTLIQEPEVERNRASGYKKTAKISRRKAEETGQRFVVRVGGVSYV